MKLSAIIIASSVSVAAASIKYTRGTSGARCAMIVTDEEDSPLLTCGEAVATIATTDGVVLKNGGYVDVMSSTSKPEGCSIKTVYGKYQAYLNTNKNGKGSTDTYAQVCAELEASVASVEAASVASVEHSVVPHYEQQIHELQEDAAQELTLAEKIKIKCAAENCLKWSCTEWCECYDEAAETAGAYDLVGCKDDNDNSCVCN
jgi:hypothetical protein